MINICRYFLIAVVGFVCFTSLGYTYRQYECRAEAIVVMIKAPDSDNLIPVSVSICSLPEQWGGLKSAVPDFLYGK